MYRGRFVETGPSEMLLRRPAHPYTRALIDAAPKLQAARRRSRAPVPELTARSTGCAYAARCAFAQARCLEVAPELAPLGDGRQAACYFPL
jgi:oligopeptide/dipeptide ABC transporter ATP-binding protein